MLAIVGASGKIGGATLAALLERKIVPPDQIVALTSSHPEDEKWNTLTSKGIQVRHATFDDPKSMEHALKGTYKLFLVSSPRIQLDYDPNVPAPPGEGREKDHFVVLDAAQMAGVTHIYYTSLAFANPSKSHVMTAHERTEKRLRELEEQGVFDITILREGLYNESWPLYLGYYNPQEDDRTEVVLADEGDRKISWTSIADLGSASAMIIADEASKWKGKCVYLSKTSDPKTMRQIASLVAESTKKVVVVRSVSKDEHIKHYVQDRGMPEKAVKWWAATYEAIKDGECEISDGTFDALMARAGIEPTSVDQTIDQMVAKTVKST
jgi:nucleoside-diphosphate-sugar epimerase